MLIPSPNLLRQQGITPHKRPKITNESPTRTFGISSASLTRISWRARCRTTPSFCLPARLLLIFEGGWTRSAHRHWNVCFRDVAKLAATDDIRAQSCRG